METTPPGFNGNPGARYVPMTPDDLLSLFTAFGQQPDGVERGRVWMRAKMAADPERCAQRAGYAADLAAAEAETAYLQGEIAKMEAALEGGPAYLPADDVAILPRNWPGRVGLAVFSLALVALEVSSAVNVSALTFPVVQSVTASWCMAAPIAAVPAAVKCINGRPHRGPRFWIGLVALGGALAYGLALARLLGSPGEGVDLGWLLRFQLAAETLELAALTMVITKFVTPRASEAVKHMLDAAQRRRKELAGVIKRTLSLQAGLQAAEDAAVEEAVILIRAAGSAREATERHLREMAEQNRGLLGRFFGRGN